MPTGGHYSSQNTSQYQSNLNMYLLRQGQQQNQKIRKNKTSN